MRRFSLPLAVALAASLLTVLLAGCASESPEEKLARIRGTYSAKLNGFIVQQQPTLSLEEVTAGSEEMAGEQPAPQEEAAPVEPEVELEEPVASVLLDILIRHDSVDTLPGVTVDISQVDAAESEKGRWRVWFDTAGVPKATDRQFTHVLEDVDYQEGDGFHVEVRHPVPEAERSEYPELTPGS